MSTTSWEPADWFWESFEGCGHQLPVLRSRLAELPDDRKREFQRQYKRAMALVYYPYWQSKGNPTGSLLQIAEGEGYSSWVVSQGRAFYEEVRTRPAELPRFLTMFLRVVYCNELNEMAWKGGTMDENAQAWIDAPLDTRFTGDLVTLIHNVGGDCDTPAEFYKWLELHWDELPKS